VGGKSGRWETTPGRTEEEEGSGAHERRQRTQRHPQMLNVDGPAAWRTNAAGADGKSITDPLTAASRSRDTGRTSGRRSWSKPSAAETEARRGYDGREIHAPIPSPLEPNRSTEKQKEKRRKEKRGTGQRSGQAAAGPLDVPGGPTRRQQHSNKEALSPPENTHGSTNCEDRKYREIATHPPKYTQKLNLTANYTCQQGR
jgi:hypothetical protein